ncbi:MAG: thioredoxin family protein, partial [Deltaproteobacteria bacterium]|nr:thioredoxin family protein [Deltaproteobacteria bacterium]
LGAGCSQCRKLEADVIAVLAEMGVPADVEHVTDIQRTTSYGVMGVPALLINGKVKAVGGVPPKEKIKQLIITAMGRA